MPDEDNGNSGGNNQSFGHYDSSQIPNPVDAMREVMHSRGDFSDREGSSGSMPMPSNDSSFSYGYGGSNSEPLQGTARTIETIALIIMYVSPVLFFLWLLSVGIGGTWGHVIGWPWREEWHFTVGWLRVIITWIVRISGLDKNG